MFQRSTLPSSSVFCILILCSVVVGYQHSRGPSCLQLQGTVNGNGKKGIDIGLEYKRGAQSRSQEDAGKDGDASSRRGVSRCT